jgi:hypothetical protein
LRVTLGHELTNTRSAHAFAAPSIVVGGAPSEAIVVKDGPCFFGKRQLARSQLIVTPSLNVTFVCHDNTA